MVGIRFIAGSRRRFDKPSRNALNARKARAEATTRQQYNGWSIDVSKQEVGTTVRRKVFNVSMRNLQTDKVESLANFPSPGSAIAAAKNRIDISNIRPAPRWRWLKKLQRKQRSQ